MRALARGLGLGTVAVLLAASGAVQAQPQPAVLASPRLGTAIPASQGVEELMIVETSKTA